jgi:oxygen-dependent protoporphyrinogen oxidase
LIARRRQARQQRDATAQSTNGLGPRGRTSSFEDGLGTLIDAVAAALDGTIHCRDRVVAIAQANDRAPADGAFRWRVTTASGAHFEADAVVIAAPSRDAARLLTAVDRTVAQSIGEMPTAPVVVVALAFEAHALADLPGGFGFLAPRSEGLRTLGCIWDSCIFPGRAPAGAFLLRCILGGAHDPSAAHADDESVVATVRRDLGAAMGVTGPPILTRVYRHADGIAQYVRGHRDRLRLIAERLNAVPGLWVTGSSYYGVSINACVERAPRQADEILAFLGAG